MSAVWHQVVLLRLMLFVEVAMLLKARGQIVLLLDMLCLLMIPVGMMVMVVVHVGGKGINCALVRHKIVVALIRCEGLVDRYHRTVTPAPSCRRRFYRSGGQNRHHQLVLVLMLMVMLMMMMVGVEQRGRRRSSRWGGSLHSRGRITLARKRTCFPASDVLLLSLDG